MALPPRWPPIRGLRRSYMRPGARRHSAEAAADSRLAPLLHGAGGASTFRWSASGPC